MDQNQKKSGSRKLQLPSLNQYSGGHYQKQGGLFKTPRVSQQQQVPATLMQQQAAGDHDGGIPIHMKRFERANQLSGPSRRQRSNEIFSVSLETKDSVVALKHGYQQNSNSASQLNHSAAARQQHQQSHLQPPSQPLRGKMADQHQPQQSSFWYQTPMRQEKQNNKLYTEVPSAATLNASGGRSVNEYSYARRSSETSNPHQISSAMNDFSVSVTVTPRRQENGGSGQYIIDWDNLVVDDRTTPQKKQEYKHNSPSNQKGKQSLVDEYQSQYFPEQQQLSLRISRKTTKQSTPAPVDESRTIDLPSYQQMGPQGPQFKQQITFKHRQRRSSAGDQSEREHGISAKIDLNATVIGEISNIVHPSIIRNQNLFSTQTEMGALVEPEQPKKVKLRPSSPKKGMSTNRESEESPRLRLNKAKNLASAATSASATGNASNKKSTDQLLPELSQKFRPPSKLQQHTIDHSDEVQQPRPPMDVRIKVIPRKQITLVTKKGDRHVENPSQLRAQKHSAQLQSMPNLHQQEVINRSFLPAAVADGGDRTCAAQLSVVSSEPRLSESHQVAQPAAQSKHKHEEKFRRMAKRHQQQQRTMARIASNEILATTTKQPPVVQHHQFSTQDEVRDVSPLNNSQFQRTFRPDQLIRLLQEPGGNTNNNDQSALMHQTSARKGAFYHHEKQRHSQKQLKERDFSP